MIRKGEHPDSDPKENKFLNKFIGKNEEGYRGELIAVSKNGKQGIILFNNNLILVKETNPSGYPKEVNEFLTV